MPRTLPRVSDDRRLAIRLVVVLVGLGLFAIAGHSRISGPGLFGIYGTHGVHLDDLIVLALWIVGVLGCVRLWQRDR